MSQVETATQEEHLDDRIRRLIAEDLATELPDNQLSPIQHYVRQHASIVVSTLVGDDDFLTYLSRNLQGIQIRAINRLLTESNARAPVPRVVRSYVPGSLRLMAVDTKEEDGTRKVVLDSVETKDDKGEWAPVKVDDTQAEALASVLVDSGCELGVYQFLTSDIALEEHQRVVLDLHDQKVSAGDVVSDDTLEA